MDDGLGGSFISKLGYITPQLSQQYTAKNLIKGRMYRFRYRAKNCQGWSQFSPELYAIAAEVPTRPPPL